MKGNAHFGFSQSDGFRPVGTQAFVIGASNIQIGFSIMLIIVTKVRN
jgi:hypothetical protein